MTIVNQFADVDCLYVGGDSWTFGSELRDPAVGGDDDFTEVNSIYRNTYSWPALLGQQFNLEVVNDGQAGASNHFIIRKAIKGITNLLRAGRRPFVILSWTQLQRLEIWDAKREHYINAVGPADCTSPAIAFDIWGKYSSDFSNVQEFLQQAIMLDGFLKAQSVPYFATNVFKENYELMQKFINDKLEFGHLFYQMNNQVNMEKHLYELSLSQIVKAREGISYGKGGHPLKDGHKVIADYLQAQIEKRFKFKTTKA
jgi:hypothetical protein